MKKIATGLFYTVLLIGLTIISFAAQAQQLASTDNNGTLQIVHVTNSTGATPAVARLLPMEPGSIIIAKKPAAPTDTAWKPQRRLWGYSFGDFYYDAYADNDIVSSTGLPEGGAGALSKRGGETNYSGVPTYRNAFQFRRVYLGYDYDITRKFKAEFLLASEPTANTGVSGTTTIQNSDNLADGKMAFFIKNINLRVRDIWTGTDLVFGELSTPGFGLAEPGTNGPSTLSEATWGYRSVERTITDFHKNNSYDVGAALQGTFDPASKNFGYVLMVGNNSTASLLSAANANTGFYKIFYGDVWGKFFDQKLYADIYADYAKTGPASAAVPGPGQEHNMLKLFASYNTNPITIGIEAYTQNIANALSNTTTGQAENATVHGLSVWAKGAVVKNLGYFARYDTYNPDTQFNSDDTYSNVFNTNYGSYTPFVKEQFYTVGLDYNPTKNVHFMPNLWLLDYADQRAPSSSSYVLPDHTLVFRATFFFTFGK